MAIDRAHTRDFLWAAIALLAASLTVSLVQAVQDGLSVSQFLILAASMLAWPLLPLWELFTTGFSLANVVFLFLALLPCAFVLLRWAEHRGRLSLALATISWLVLGYLCAIGLAKV